MRASTNMVPGAIALSGRWRKLHRWPRRCCAAALPVGASTPAPADFDGDGRDDRGQLGHRTDPRATKTSNGVRFTYFANEEFVHMEEWTITHGTTGDITKIEYIK